jgi:thymidylate synthase (FAD)
MGSSTVLKPTDKCIQVLDKGFVRLVDFMGSDEAVVQAARVSYGKGTKKKSEDRALIRYMMSHRHTSVFEQVVFKFHWKLPIFVARQIVRHRMTSINELSGRYSEMPDECYVPTPDRICTQSKTNKQGSGNTLEDKVLISDIIQEIVYEQSEIFRNYQNNLKDNVSREIARINLPLSTYTEWYWTINLHNLFHFLKLRMDNHSQWETQQYANAIFELIKPIVPIACEAFEDYVLNAVTFSKQEMKLLKELLEDDCFTQRSLQKEKIELSKREIEDFKKKLGINV